MFLLLASAASTLTVIWGGGVMTSAGERREKVASVRALVEKRGANPDADEARAHARAVHFTLFK